MTDAHSDSNTLGRAAVISIPDLRDYELINAVLVQSLEAGAARVCLAGAEGQRFLAAGLTGPWNAVVEIEGWAGPELAAGMNAPGLTVVCRGKAADGAGRSLRAGRLLILGEAGDALGYAQVGGTLLALRGAGARAGLNQQGGVLAMLGPVDRLAGERQSGGLLIAYREQLGPQAGRGRRGGRFVRLSAGQEGGEPAEGQDRDTLNGLLREFSEWTGIVAP